MLAHLAVNLAIMLSLCTLLLMICWAHDTLGHRVQADRTDPAECEFPVAPRLRRSQARPRASSRPEVWRSRPKQAQFWWPPSHVTAPSSLVRPCRERI
jgi:hypothetical protein